MKKENGKNLNDDDVCIGYRVPDRMQRPAGKTVVHKYQTERGESTQAQEIQFNILQVGRIVYPGDDAIIVTAYVHRPDIVGTDPGRSRIDDIPHRHNKCEQQGDRNNTEQPPFHRHKGIRHFEAVHKR